MPSLEINQQHASKKLKYDITNSIHHVFGNHKYYSDFCKVKVSHGQSVPLPQLNTQTNSTECTYTKSLEKDLSAVCTNQIDYWCEGTSLEAQEQSRFDSGIDYYKLDKCLLQDISLLLQRIAAKSERLLGNTTNLAEPWMHIRTKFDGGNVHNLCGRGSWHTRCYGGSLRINLGPQSPPFGIKIYF